MRLAIAHSLGRDEVRRRMEAKVERAGAKASEVLGAMVSVETSWIDADRLRMDVTAMGFAIPTTATIGDSDLAFEIDIPGPLLFARGLIERAIREKGEKLLA